MWWQFFFSHHCLASGAVNRQTISFVVIGLGSNTDNANGKERWQVCSVANVWGYFHFGTVHFRLSLVTYFKENYVTNELCNENAWEGIDWDPFITNIFEMLLYCPNSSVIMYC